MSEEIEPPVDLAGARVRLRDKDYYRRIHPIWGRLISGVPNSGEIEKLVQEIEGKDLQDPYICLKIGEGFGTYGLARRDAFIEYAAMKDNPYHRSLVVGYAETVVLAEAGVTPDEHEFGRSIQLEPQRKKIIAATERALQGYIKRKRKPKI